MSACERQTHTTYSHSDVHSSYSYATIRPVRNAPTIAPPRNYTLRCTATRFNYNYCNMIKHFKAENCLNYCNLRASHCCCPDMRTSSKCNFQSPQSGMSGFTRHRFTENIFASPFFITQHRDRSPIGKCFHAAQSTMKVNTECEPMQFAKPTHAHIQPNNCISGKCIRCVRR